jgi:hypothetical protein
MATEETKDLYKLIGSYENFSSQVLNQLEEIRNSLKEGNDRMSSIEAKQAENSTCLFHADVMAIIQKQREKDVEHDEKLGDLKTTTAVQEIKLNESEKKQLTIGAIGGGGSAIYIVARLILGLFGIHLP